MFKRYKIIFILFFIITITIPAPVFSEKVGTVKDSRASWYAVIGTAGKSKKLYVKGDIFYSGNNPAQSLRILDIKKDALVLESVTSKDGIILKPGDNVPIEDCGMIFEKTVASSVLEYNYNQPPKSITKNQIEDFTIKNLEKEKISLEKAYSAGAMAKGLSEKEKSLFNGPMERDADKKIIIKELFDKIESKKIGDNIWALDRPSTEPAMRNAGAAIVSAIKMVKPGYRMGEGTSLKFDTDIGTVVVNKDGFLVKNIAVSKLVEGFGIREGDVIKSINGYSVNSLLGIYRAYENIASDKGVKFLSVNIDREGKTRTFIYKIK